MKLVANNLSAENLLQHSFKHKGKIVEITNVTIGINTIYPAIKATAKALNINRRYIER